ncbi:MAG: hypothetical protein H0T73_19385 [Ardenticatenales bacterium]|nr:hypothetical protein [Ardenticatenales bacterium]
MNPIEQMYYACIGTLLIIGALFIISIGKSLWMSIQYIAYWIKNPRWCPKCKSPRIRIQSREVISTTTAKATSILDKRPIYRDSYEYRWQTTINQLTIYKISLMCGKCSHRWVGKEPQNREIFRHLGDYTTGNYIEPAELKSYSNSSLDDPHYNKPIELSEFLRNKQDESYSSSSNAIGSHSNQHPSSTDKTSSRNAANSAKSYLKTESTSHKKCDAKTHQFVKSEIWWVESQRYIREECKLCGEVRERPFFE